MKLKRRMILPTILMILIFILTGCGNNTKDEVKKELSLYEKIQETLSNVETYEAEATVRYISNNNSNAYRTKQYAKNTGEYRIHVVGPEESAGNITIFDGKMVCQYNENVAGQLAIGTNDSSERVEILLTSFVKNYFEQSDETVSVSNLNDYDDITVLEAKIPGTHPYISNEKLWINNETLEPIQLIIFDNEGNERIVVTYHEFEYNKDLSDELFVIEK